MVKLEYNNKYYDILGNYSINRSSREVKYSDLVLDFTNKTTEDLPVKYQECHLVDVDYNGDNIYVNKVIFTGYVNTIVLPNMKNKEEYRELEIELLSPMALSTRRTITAIGTYELRALIDTILQPLYSDGFELKELNIGGTETKVNYLVETIESALNKLSNKYNFWWYIDENKGIYINSIDYQFALKPKLIYNEDTKLAGLIDIVPSIDATDYCNVVNFTNLRTWQFSYYGLFEYIMYGPGGEIIKRREYNIEKDRLFDVDTIIKPEDDIDFYHPFDSNIKNILKSEESNSKSEAFSEYKNTAFYMKYTYSDNTTGEVYIKVVNNQLVVSNNATLENNPSVEKEFEFERDSFFSNLITGFKYNGTKNIVSITTLFSGSALMWTRLKFQNLKEINDMKGKISTSGQIEKTIDMNEQWKTLNEVQEIANSYIKIKSSQSDKIVLRFDKNHDFKVGDIIEIHRPSFLIDNSYIVTDITEKYLYKKFRSYELELRNSDYYESYIDLFRYKETEEVDEKVYNLTTIDYEEDTIREVHEVV